MINFWEGELTSNNSEKVFKVALSNLISIKAVAKIRKVF